MKWAVFFVLSFMMFGCGGGGSGGGGGSESPGNGNPSQPADLAGLWQGEVNGYSSSLFIDTDGTMTGSWLDSDNVEFYSVYGKVPMRAESSTDLLLCEHQRGEDGQQRTFAAEGACQSVQWNASTVEGQTIQGSLAGQSVEFAYAGDTAEPVTPVSGCRNISTEYISQGDYLSSDSMTLNIMSDGTVTGSRTERMDYDAPQPGPVVQWDIAGEVASHHIDGVQRLELFLTSQTDDEEIIDGLIWEDLVYFVSTDSGSPYLVYRYGEHSSCL